MKEFRLSRTSDRVAGVISAAGTTAAFAALLYAVRGDIALLIFCGLGALLICGLLFLYARNVFRAVCIADAGTKQLQVRGIKDYTVDVSGATLMQTIAKKNGQSTVRMIVFSDEEDRILATVPTMYTFRGGIWADPVAREMAEYLGIAFQQNVPDWEFDKKKYQEHIKEESERQRKEAKERRRKKAQLRMQKLKNRK